MTKLNFSRFEKKSLRLLFSIFPDIDPLLTKIGNQKLYQTILTIDRKLFKVRKFTDKLTISCALKLKQNKLAILNIILYIKIWDLITGNCIMTLFTEEYDSNFCLLELSKTRLVCGSEVYISIFDIVTGCCIVKKRFLNCHCY